ncbi:ABC transporter ATP-binding protein [Treponema primitia]|uniref:ABC transporter ATP-binding protein n=1 Tax=Treponema primitia TaxID=88058 RepID=UPI0002555231|nr:ABC transporter ATP-binding protein [Treponema primitia]
MSLSIRNISFGFTEKPLFKNMSLELGEESPVAILGSSGCGKTTLLRLMAGLLRPEVGSVEIGGKASFVFQENRLLPWYTALENISLPIEGTLGKKEARDRAMYFLRKVSLEEKAGSYPNELSGGQGQRVAIARAFAYPSPLILMDEPFQSLDIPLRIQLMDMVSSLLAVEQRLAVAVTHDPREAVYLGRRILILGKGGIVFDQGVDLSPEDRAYGSSSNAGLEKKLLEVLYTIA